MATNTAPRRESAEPASLPDPLTGAIAVAGPRLIRRRAVPSSRALVGAVLITLAIAGAFTLAQWGGHGPTTSFVVVTKAVAPGDRIDAAAVELVAMDLDDRVRGQAFTAIARVAGATALAPLSPGQLVQAAEISSPTVINGQAVTGHEITFPVSRDRVPPNLRRGERVAILATYGTGNDARTTTTAQQAIVIAFDTSDSVAAARTVRLTVLLSDATTVIETAHASQVADLTIVRTTNSDQPLPSTFRSAVTTVKS
jgi:hypothetical protein